MSLWGDVLEEILQGVWRAYFDKIVDWFTCTRTGRVCTWVLGGLMLGAGVWAVGAALGWW